MRRPRNGQPSAPEHASKLSVQNRLLMLLQWLVHYPTYEELAIQLGIAAATVGKELYHSMSVTINALAGEIQWPSPAERSQLALLWPHTSGAFAAIDTTSHRRCKPTANQTAYYNGHHRMHELKSQMIILPNGYVCHAAIGYQVAVADTTIYRSSGISAFLGQNDMILGDKGFQGFGGRLIAIKAVQSEHHSRPRHGNVARPRSNRASVWIAQISMVHHWPAPTTSE